MSESPLIIQSIEFSISAVNYYKFLVYNQKEYVISKQFLRSATSIGANIHEARYAISKADFIAKIHISLKEASEAEYWLIVLERTGFLKNDYLYLKKDCDSIKKMLVATLKTSKLTKQNN